jgi:hypothetical protein
MNLFLLATNSRTVYRSFELCVLHVIRQKLVRSVADVWISENVEGAGLRTAIGCCPKQLAGRHSVAINVPSRVLQCELRSDL